MPFIFLIFLSINLFGNDQWIKIEPINQTKTSQEKKLSLKDVTVTLPKVGALNKMVRKVTLIKQLIETISQSSKQEKKPTNEKNWFVLNNTVK
jgi:hypothetical protein